MLNPFDEIRSETATAAEQIRQNKARLESSTGNIATGQLFLFETGAEEGIEWAVVKQHVDDPSLWFAVPFDQHYQVGTWDVFVAEYSDAGEGALRCGAGIWVHASDFAGATRTGFLEDGYVQKVSSRLAAMVQSDSVGAFHRPEVDEEVEYQEWMDVVMAAAERLSEALSDSIASEREAISLADFSKSWASAPGVRRQAPVLAASEDGLAAGPSTPVEPLPGIVIAKNLPGTLVAVQESKGLRLQYHMVGGEEVPVDVDGRIVDWSTPLQDVRQSRRAFSCDEEVVVRVDGRESVICPDAADRHV